MTAFLNTGVKFHYHNFVFLAGLFSLLSGCKKPVEQLPVGPIEITYTSVRGASPQVVDYFVVKSAPCPRGSENADQTARVAVFCVPRETEGDLKRSLAALMAETGWERMNSSAPSVADGPFRRLAIKIGGYSRFVEIHENGSYDVARPLGDEEFQQFYHLVSSVRYLAETHGFRVFIEDRSLVNELDIPRVQK